MTETPLPPPYLTIKVDGFRSLHNAVIPLSWGINVFVGPNGSGKTNVIAATEFLSTFIKHGIHAAIAKNGGAYRVFSNEQISARGINPKLSFSIHGQLHSPAESEHFVLDDDDVDSAKKVLLDFSYALTLVLDKAKFEVYVDSEMLSWKRVDEGADTVTVSSSASDEKKISCSEDFQMDRIYSRILPTFMAEALIRRLESESDSSTEKVLKDISSNGRSVFRTPALMTKTDLHTIQEALTFERSYNISPEKVRQAEDIASSKEISADGSGTISKLYDLKRQSGNRKNKRSGKKSTSSYDKIITSFEQVNDQITGFDVSPNLRTGNIDSTILFGRNKIKLPITSASDGTAKWLAMLTIIRSGEFSSYCIEEPENYLHPAAQRLFIKILRSATKGVENAFYVVSTHSETIVNAIDVSELRICEYEEDGTQIRIVKSQDKVREAINKTGFGLGFLYANQRL